MTDVKPSASSQLTRNEVVSGMSQVGFVYMDTGEFIDLHLQPPAEPAESSAESEGRKETPQEDTGEAPKGVTHTGGMPDLRELLEHHRISTVVLEVSGSPNQVEQVLEYPTAKSPFVDQFVTALSTGLVEIAGLYAERGLSLDELGSPEQLAQELLSGIPGPSRWDDLIGPFLSPKAVSLRLGITEQEVSDLSSNWLLLGLLTSDQALVFPSFQFTDQGSVIPGLSEVMQPFAEIQADRWSVAGWLVSDFASLEGATAITALWELEDLSPLLALARSAAARWDRGESD